MSKNKNADRFYLPQPDQPFEGKVDTPIGTLEFSNQYPSKESMETLLDNHGLSRRYAGVFMGDSDCTSFANLQYFTSSRCFKILANSI